MNSLLIAIPLLISVALLFCFGAGRACVQLLAAHQRKLSILRRFERNPQAFESSKAVIDALAQSDEAAQRALRQDYAITGTTLAVLGAAAVFTGQFLHFGYLAVGLYIGGFTCAVLGILVALFGYLLRALARPLIPTDNREI